MARLFHTEFHENSRFLLKRVHDQAGAIVWLIYDAAGVTDWEIKCGVSAPLIAAVPTHYAALLVIAQILAKEQHHHRDVAEMVATQEMLA